MHVVLAPDSFSGLLPAGQVAAALAEGWHAWAPHDRLSLVPLSDGGPGFVDVLAGSLGGQVVATVVEDPLARPAPATVLVVERAGRRTAYVESAQACGLHLLAGDEHDPAVTSSFGVGQLLTAALDLSPDRVVVGLGGAGTDDAGAGMLAALGAGPRARLGRGGLALAAVEADDLAGLESVVARLRDVDLVVATDLELPLLGLNGASAVLAPGMGASEEIAQRLENALGSFAAMVSRLHPPPVDLLTGLPMRPERLPGAGAAGGLGYALLLLGGRRVAGVEAVLDAVGFDDLLEQADLVVTGEASFDWRSLRGGVVAGVAAAASRVGVPAIVVARQCLVGRREAMSLGVSGMYAVIERPEQLAASHADPAGTLRDRAARVARTWSPAPG